MKNLSGFLSLASILFAFNAHAAVATGYLACSNGDVQKVGDAHFAVNILEDGLQFSPYESGFVVDAADVTVKGDTYTIVDKSVAVSSEGTKSFQVINAILVLDKSKRKLNVALSYDKAAFNSFELTCVQK